MEAPAIKRINIIYLLVILGVVILLLVDRCAQRKDLQELSEQFARYKDTVITHRVVDGDVASDSKGAELTLDQYRTLDAQRYASFERLMRSNNSQMLATVSLLISRPPVTGEAPVTVNPTTKAMTIDMTDSCSLMGEVVVDSLGIARKNISFRPDSLDLVIYRERLKWYLGKEVTASGVIRNNCGTITGQKAIVVTPGKKKAVQTNLFKAGVVVVAFETLRFIITGKL